MVFLKPWLPWRCLNWNWRQKCIPSYWYLSLGYLWLKKKNLNQVSKKKKPICNYGLVTHLCFLFIAENWQEKLACMGRTQEYLIVFSIKINQFAEKLGWKVQDAVHNSCGVQYIWEFDPSFFFSFFLTTFWPGLEDA